MAATNRKAPVKRAAANGHSLGGLPVLKLTSDAPSGDGERIPIFTIDGTEYSVPAEPSGHIGMNATHLWASDSPAAANDYVMTEMLGAEGYAALRACKGITRHQFRQLVASITEHAMGSEEEDPKAP